LAPFFVEEVRKHLERQYGAKVLYEDGLSVTTTLDPALQDFANRALEQGLRRYDKRHGWRRPARNLLNEHRTIDTFKDDRWNRPIAPGDVVPAVVVSAPKTGAARLQIGRLHADLVREGYAWTRKQRRRISSSRAIDRCAGHQAGRGGRRVRSPSSRPRLLKERSRHRQPLRSIAMVRPELQPQQIQPRGAGVPAARIHIQANRLHSGDRSRFHANVHSDDSRSAFHPATDRSMFHNYTTGSGPVTLRYASKSRGISLPSR
jgi:hypothetical protein